MTKQRGWSAFRAGSWQGPNVGRGWKQTLRAKVQTAGPGELAEGFHLSYLESDSCRSTIALAAGTTLHDFSDPSSSFTLWNPGCVLLTVGTFPRQSLGTGYASLPHLLGVFAYISPSQRDLSLLPLNPANFSPPPALLMPLTCFHSSFHGTYHYLPAKVTL